MAKKLFFIGWVVIFLCLAIAGEEVFSQDKTVYPLQTKYPNIMLYKADTLEKVLALTFDDGPDVRYTPLILDVLKKHDVKATFFLLGTRVDRYPQVAKRIAEEGHTIGNHTYWHPDLTQSGPEQLTWEIEKNAEALEATIGETSSYFRAPYGALNETLVEKLGELGYRGIGWSVDSLDWKSLSKDEIIDHMIQGVHPGAIILMHSAGHWSQNLSGTVAALDELIPLLQDQGYSFITIPQMWELHEGSPYK